MRPPDRLSARAALELLLYTPLDWPGKTVRLEPDSVQEHLQRASSGAPSIAELYHTNSRLGPAGAGRLLAGRTDVDGVRRAAVERSAAAAPKSAPDDPKPPVQAARLLLATRDSVGLDLFYALELRLVHDELVYLFEPVSAGCAVVARLESAVVDAAERALRLFAPRDRARFETLVLVLGRFGRHDVLYGPRGYRRTLIEAGRLSHELLRLAGETGTTASLLTEFGDDAVDTVALANGVDESCLAVIELEGVGDGET